MFHRFALPLRVATLRSLETRSSRSVCGPSVLRRPAGLTSKPHLKFRIASYGQGQLVSRSGLFQPQLGLSVLRRPALQPRHIEPLENSRSGAGVCSAWLARWAKQNHQMQVTQLRLQLQRLCSGSVVRVRGTSPRRAAVRQSPWPNPSVEPTKCSKLHFAAHLERWAAAKTASVALHGLSRVGHGQCPTQA